MTGSQFCITHPRFAAVIAIVMVLLGGLAISVLPISQYPDITPPQVIVSVNYPGANAQILTETVAIPIENEINGVEDMLYMSSTSNDNGVYQLTITFNIGTDPDIAQVKVQNRLQQVEPILPPIVRQEGIEVKLQSANMLGMLVLKGKNNSYSDLFLSNYAYTYLKNPLSRVHGVGDVTVYGPQHSIRVWINPMKLNALGLSAQDIIQAIENQNVQASVGSLGAAPSPVTNAFVLTLSAKGFLKSVSDFEEIVVAVDTKGGIVRLKDVAEVSWGADTYQMTSLFNNQPAVIMALSQTPGTNSLQTMQAVRQEIKTLTYHFPEGLELEVVYDSTDFVRASLKGIIETLLITFLLVVGVVYLFLQNIFATFIPMITIPVSLISTFAVIYVLGFDINILTLFALILAIGLVVDDAIVVVERVQYLMANRKLPAKEASIQAMKDISTAVIATTLVLLSIFVPVGLMAGITGKIYQQFAITIATAVVFSSVNALTLSPALCALFLGRQSKNTLKIFDFFNEMLEWTKKRYISAVRFFCEHLKTSSFLISCTLIGTFFLFFIRPTSFIPQEDQGVIFANIQLPETASRNRTEAVLEKLSQKILALPGVRYFISVVGVSFLGGQGENIAMGVVGLKPWEQRTTKTLSLAHILNGLQENYTHNTQASIEFYALPSIPGVGTSDGLSFQINAVDEEISFERLFTSTQAVLQKIRKSPNFVFGFSTLTPGSPHLFLEIDRTKALNYHVPISNIFSVLQANLGSQYVNNIPVQGQVNKVIVQAAFPYRQDQNNIENLYVPSLGGNMVRLKNLIEFKTILSPKIVYRFNQYLSAPVTAATKQEVSSGQGIQQVQKMVDELGPKYTLTWTGLSLQEVKTSGLVLILIVLAVIFGYLFLVGLYESWLTAFSVIFSNVFALLGALIGLMIWGLPLSIYAQLGVVLLIGLASKNAILIVEFILQARGQGQSLVQSCIYGAKERFRAVLMTALTFILGVVPMLLATGAGASSQISIGVTVFAGMLAATCIGILFIPALYGICEGIGRHCYFKVPVPKIRRKRKKI